jgi:hypothetical protein
MCLRIISPCNKPVKDQGIGAANTNIFCSVLINNKVKCIFLGESFYQIVVQLKTF